MEQKYIQTAINYKKNIAGHFVLVEGAKLMQRIAGERFSVTRKIDGHLQVVFYEQGKAFMLNSSGRQKAESLKCLDVFAASLKKAGVKYHISDWRRNDAWNVEQGIKAIQDGAEFVFIYTAELDGIRQFVDP